MASIAENGPEVSLSETKIYPIDGLVAAGRALLMHSSEEVAQQAPTIIKAMSDELEMLSRGLKDLRDRHFATGRNNDYPAEQDIIFGYLIDSLLRAEKIKE